MEKRIADIKDLNKIYKFYDDVIKQQEFDEYSPEWTKDVYPSIDDLKTHLENNDFYIALIDDEIVSCGALTFKEDEMYKNAGWSKNFNDDEICVLHLFATHPKYRLKGYSKEMLEYLINIAGKHSKAIHIDVVKGNISAKKLYEKVGFKYCGQFKVWYEDTGDMIADLYEYIL